MASISSMKMIDGARLRASPNRSRTREAPTPTNSSTKPEPVMEKNGTDASPATARASSVLPVPGGPAISTPRGRDRPGRGVLLGVRRKSTTSLMSRLTPSYPATSAKVVVGRSASTTFALDRPTPGAQPTEPALARGPADVDEVAEEQQERQERQQGAQEAAAGAGRREVRHDVRVAHLGEEGLVDALDAGRVVRLKSSPPWKSVR